MSRFPNVDWKPRAWVVRYGWGADAGIRTAPPSVSLIPQEIEPGVLFPEDLGLEPIGGDGGNRTLPRSVRSKLMDTRLGYRTCAPASF